MDPSSAGTDGQEISPTFAFQWYQRAEHFLACAEVVARACKDAYRDAFSGKENESFAFVDTTTKPLMVGHAHYFLLGLALELMLKAVWLNSQKGIVRKVPAFWARGKAGHDLIRLAQEIAFPLPKNLQPALRDLTDTIVWYGRYPADFKRRKGQPEKSVFNYPWTDLIFLFDALKRRFKAETPVGVRHSSGITGPKRSAPK